jgi:hypothetical protein
MAASDIASSLIIELRVIGGKRGSNHPWSAHSKEASTMVSTDQRA